MTVKYCRDEVSTRLHILPNAAVSTLDVTARPHVIAWRTHDEIK